MTWRASLQRCLGWPCTAHLGPCLAPRCRHSRDASWWTCLQLRKRCDERASSHVTVQVMNSREPPHRLGSGAAPPLHNVSRCNRRPLTRPPRMRCSRTAPKGCHTWLARAQRPLRPPGLRGLALKAAWHDNAVATGVRRVIELAEGLHRGPKGVQRLGIPRRCTGGASAFPFRHSLLRERTAPA